MIKINYLPLIITSIAGLSTTLGTIFIFFKIKKQYTNKFITFCLSLSLIIMIYISIFDLIPTAFINIIKSRSITFTILGLIFFTGIGILLTNIISNIKITQNNLYKLGIISMISLILHNIPEGIITYITSINDISIGIKIAISIMLHNIPEGICIAVPIYFGTHSKKRAIIYTLIAGLSEPVGGLLFYLIFKSLLSPIFIYITMYIVSGIMVSLAINKIFPEAKKYREDKYIMLGFISGIFLITFMHIFL